MWVNLRRYNGGDIACLTRQQTNDLLAAHLRWGHRSFRRCAYILGVPAPVKAPFCEACVEAKASRHPRGPRGVKSDMVREPAPRPGFRLYFDPTQGQILLLSWMILAVCSKVHG